MADILTHLKLKYDCMIDGVTVTAGTVVKAVGVRSRQFYPEYLVEAFSDTPSACREWLPFYMVDKVEPSPASISKTEGPKKSILSYAKFFRR